MVADADAARRDKEVDIARRADRIANGGWIVVCDPEGNRHASGLLHQCREGGAVHVGEALACEDLFWPIEGNEFIPRDENSDAGLPVHDRRADRECGEQCELMSSQLRPGSKGQGAEREIAAGPSHITSGITIVMDLHRLGAAIGVFLADDRVRAVRNRRPGEDPCCLARTEPAGGASACGYCGNDAQSHGCIPSCAAHIRGTHRIAIHRCVRPRWERHHRTNIFGEDMAECVGQRHAEGGLDAHAGDNGPGGVGGSERRGHLLRQGISTGGRDSSRARCRIPP